MMLLSLLELLIQSTHLATDVEDIVFNGVEQKRFSGALSRCLV